MRKKCCSCNAQFIDTYGENCLDCSSNRNIKSKNNDSHTIFYINEWTFERQNSTGYFYGFNNKTKSTIHGHLIFYKDGGITLQNKNQQLILKYPNNRLEKTN